MGSFEKYPPSQRLGIGPWQIDLARGTVSGQDGAGALTPRAEELLLLLARYANLLVTREQILETVWAGRVVEDAAITNCIWQIRKAIGERGKEILQTRAKRGYVLTVADSDWILDPESSGDTTRPEPVIDDPPVSAVDGMPPVPAPRRTRWLPRFAVVIALVALIAMIWAAIAWQATRESSSRIVLRPGVDMTVSLQLPQTLGWVRDSVLRSAVDRAYLRGVPVVLLQKPQKNNPFAGPHLQIAVVPQGADRIKAELILKQGKLRFANTFVGPAIELHKAIGALMDASLASAGTASRPATDALVAGMVAELQFDYLGAMAEYRRALGLEPDFVDARIAAAAMLAELGDSKQAQALLAAAEPDADWTEGQRCTYALLATNLLPEKLPRDACDLAGIESNLNPKGAGLAKRRLDAIGGGPMGATRWYLIQAMSVEAKQYLGLHTEAEFVSGNAERIAADAGWERARWKLAAERCKSVLYTGRNDEGIRLCEASANGLEAMGDALSSLPPRTLAIRIQRREPGPETATQRARYRAIIDRARSIGNPQGEVDALLAVIALNRDDDQAWRTDMTRIEALVDKYYAPGSQAGVINDLTTEYIAKRRYRMVLKRVSDSGTSGSGQPGDELTRLYLKAQSHFALDELAAAVARIDEMEKKGFDVAETNPCLFAWLFVEVGKPDRARITRKGCPYEEWDSKSMAGLRGDWGLLADALLHRLDGEPERSWPTVRPRIDALLGTRDLGRLEAEGLTFLARHATAMPGADPARLKRALAIASAMAEQDGAGPNLRFGVHVLRWRLCMADRRTDCGPPLPPWAQDDHLERRLALQAASH